MEVIPEISAGLREEATERGALKEGAGHGCVDAAGTTALTQSCDWRIRFMPRISN